MDFNYSFCMTIFLIFLLKIKCLLCSDYYRMPEGYLMGNSLQPGESDIEDFFWTGSGDGPYINRKPMLMPDSNVGDSFIRTATILATVYINENGQDMSDDPLCTYDCNKLEMPEKYSPSDRRFWLLTIIAGFFGPEDYPVLEDKLAQLYRIAFMRQQARHLGFENGIYNETTIQQQTGNSRKKRKTEFYFHPRKKHKMIKREAVNLMNNLTGIHYVAQNLTRDKEKLIKPRPGIKVNVLIHNITHLTEAESGLGDDSSASPSGNATKLANQTEIIYTVFVGGKPVLATTAANDMQYVTTDEVAKVMDKMVYIKAEPYLKEPHATPLIPASPNGNSYIIQVISENPLLFILTCLTFFLLIVLLIGILLITTSKRKHKNEALKSARETLMEVRTADDNIDSGIIRTEAIDGDLENLNMDRINAKNEKNIGSPVLHFPLPPGNRPTSTSSSTSDSSLYYQRQPMRSDKKIDDRYAMRRDDNLYTMILNKKDEKRQDKRTKTRRKYMTENRVGSIDDSKTQTNSDSDLFETNANIQSIAYDHNEAFNPNVQISSHYHKNKMMLDRNFEETRTGSKSRSRKTGQHINVNTADGIEAVNKELLKTIQRHERSSLDSGSIGSYLSMASVKSFPRCGVPEPLSRVLEPLSVTHLDHYDADVDTTKTYRTIPSELDRNFHRSSSDGADPGVVGPIVWEMHKQEIEKKTVVITSPIRDPVRTRNRFEGLLEGAIKLYEGGKKSDDRKPKNDSISPSLFRDFRGKSAPKVKNAGNLSRNGSGILRPFTAGNLKPISTHSTQPPSPANKRAWSSGAPSPMVRPMSAGPFHRPAPPAIDVARVLAPAESTIDRTALSTAPLIQAIQDELKKFNKN